VGNVALTTELFPIIAAGSLV